MDSTRQGSGWTVTGQAATYHDSPSGEDIEVGFVWAVARGDETRTLRIEAEHGATYNDVVVASVLRNALAEDDLPSRIVILASGDLRVVPVDA